MGNHQRRSGLGYAQEGILMLGFIAVCILFAVVMAAVVFVLVNSNDDDDDYM